MDANQLEVTSDIYSLSIIAIEAITGKWQL